MQAAPTASSHHDVTAASASPATPATQNKPNAAAFTCRGGASRAATSRTGPTRRSSEPRPPSLESLAKLTPTSSASQPTSASPARHQENLSYPAAPPEPMSTGTTAAGSVLG